MPLYIYMAPIKIIIRDDFVLTVIRGGNARLRLDFLEPDERKRNEWGWGRRGSARGIAAGLGLILIFLGVLWLIIHSITGTLFGYGIGKPDILRPFYFVVVVSMIGFGVLFVALASRITLRQLIVGMAVMATAFALVYFE
ncbi:MAG: hypothetical protein WED04_02340 [Promethearchaeati archaeon SRVP18_Atabeyarchaeia-1]